MWPPWEKYSIHFATLPSSAFKTQMLSARTHVLSKNWVLDQQEALHTMLETIRNMYRYSCKNLKKAMWCVAFPSFWGQKFKD